MTFRQVRFSRSVRRKMTYKHGVEEWEALQVLASATGMRQGGRGSYFSEGRTDDGRLLRVVFRVDREGKGPTAVVVTAYPIRRK